MAISSLDVEAIRKDYPILERQFNDHRLVYLDSAASSQRPRQVIEAMDRYYENSHANVHRGAYSLAVEADAAYDAARGRVAEFIGAASAREIVFTKNATESLNLFAQGWGRANLRAGDVVVTTEMEHHANIVPWQVMAGERGIEMRWIPVLPTGELDLTNLDKLCRGAKIVALTAASNVLGTLPPVKQIADVAHAAGALVVVDGTQYTPHLRTNVTEMGVDAWAFSAHKMCGPTGIGVLWARREVMEEIPYFIVGGGMIVDVTKDGFEAKDVPWRLEAGTPPIAEAVGLHAAIDYLEDIGLDAIHAHEQALTKYAIAEFGTHFGENLRVFGSQNAENRCGLASIAYKDVHPHDLAQVMDQYGVAGRAGHHCAKPLMAALGVGATMRVSWYLYNDTDDIDTLIESIASSNGLFW